MVTATGGDVPFIRLDRKVQLIKTGTNRDSTGGFGQGMPLQTFYVWAAKDDTGARNLLVSGREDAAITTTWTINYRTGIDNQWQIVYDGVTYKVIAAFERDRKRYLDILTEAVI
jgi:SPP1 family predicted phage head-tail adaptor